MVGGTVRLGIRWTCGLWSTVRAATDLWCWGKFQMNIGMFIFRQLKCMSLHLFQITEVGCSTCQLKYKYSVRSWACVFWSSWFISDQRKAPLCIKLRPLVKHSNLFFNAYVVYGGMFYNCMTLLWVKSCLALESIALATAIVAGDCDVFTAASCPEPSLLTTGHPISGQLLTAGWFVQPFVTCPRDCRSVWGYSHLCRPTTLVGEVEELFKMYSRGLVQEHWWGTDVPALLLGRYPLNSTLGVFAHTQSYNTVYKSYNSW